MFLAHFVGDVHQPLHAGFEEDEGGNTIIIRWYRRKTNLHHVKYSPLLLYINRSPGWVRFRMCDKRTRALSILR